MRWNRRLRLRTPKTSIITLDVKCPGKIAMFGCWGMDCEENSPQRIIADRINTDPEIDFMVTAGDNFYKEFDLEKNFARCYSKKMYATLGNHDVETAELQLAISDRNWVMPARNYILRVVSKTGIPRMRFIMLNTNPIYSKKEYKDSPRDLVRDMQALESFLEEVPKSDIFTIVVGHHPFVMNRHKEKSSVKRHLNEIERRISGMANAYVCADEHNLQHIIFEGLNQFILGGGGAKPDTNIIPDFRDETLFKHPFHGYGVFDPKSYTMTLHPMKNTGEFDEPYIYEF